MNEGWRIACQMGEQNGMIVVFFKIFAFGRSWMVLGTWKFMTPEFFFCRLGTLLREYKSSLPG